MKAAILREPGVPLEVIDVPVPELPASSVRVRVLATHVLSFTDQVVAGQFFPIPTPYIPGLCAIGAVEEVSDDVTGLQKGQKVFCSPLIRTRNNTAYPEQILKGWFGITANCQPLLEQWKEGSFAQQSVYPLECITPIHLTHAYEDAQLACLYYLCIAYGAFLRGEHKPGQSVLIHGATGNLGTAAVMIALALGASKVFAVGRNSNVLQALTYLDSRIETIALPERMDEAVASSSPAANVDLFIDTVGAMDHAALTEGGIAALRPHGTAVLVGGVSTSVSIPYVSTLVQELNIKGSFMYPDFAPAHVLRMVQAGLIDLNAFCPQVYPLEQINEAIAQASHSKGLAYTIIQP